MKNASIAAFLRARVAPVILATALFQAPLHAQDAAPQADDGANDTIVVTGSLLRRIDKETISPITTVSSEDLAIRGITTVQQGIQNLSANKARH